ncbi:BgTH12-01278 [Blumeria graminis f. sp. triticale]|uniref:Cytochrome c oxidase polypeptide V n=3 Tax=Blumeria graminis TaxID=34373 RepID=A0A061HH95_BLUGR|nr:Subunit Va of cytochrome [Blumeria graminis f. sp. tritici 96224]CAD6505791.1 BgTH12-01278 [Blumeria graminis f. sp. triticale]VDB93964.1 Bgt-1558 [Blumeria graminis f. sp. tritici]
MFRPITNRVSLRTLSIRRPIALQAQRQAHAISNPTLVDIEKRWEQIPPQEQAELWMALRDRMKSNWAEMTLQEKKAAYYLAFGAHGPRAEAPPGEGMKVAGYVAACVSASFLIFCLIRSFARPPPSTMTKEYQEATNEYLKSQNSEPISGISSENYKGAGYVQSPPASSQS